MKMVDIEAVRDMLAIQWGYEGIEEDIDNLPTIESRLKGKGECMMIETILKNTEELLEEVKRIERTAVWVGIDEEPHEEWECSNCGNIIETFLQGELEEHKYCHRCGAKMSTPWAEKRDEE